MPKPKPKKRTERPTSILAEWRKNNKNVIELLRMPAPSHADWFEGLSRALAMLRDLDVLTNDETDFEAGCRDGRPQQNVVYLHLLAVISTKNDGVLRAFSSVITHS